jgi:hypothetical protein
MHSIARASRSSFPIRSLPYLIATIGPGIAVVLLVHSSLTESGAVARFMTDDAYFYVKIAQHVLRGFFFSFDGLTSTNGFHPLWLFFGVGLTAIGLGGAIFWCLASAAFWLLSYWVTLGILQKHFSERAAIYCALMLVANPLLSAYSVIGMELGLFAFLFSCLLYLGLSVSPEMRLRDAVLFGLLSGLLFLARTDGIICIVAIGVAAVAVDVKRWLALPFRRTVALATCYFATLFLVALPWVIFNAVKFGSPIQDSGTVLTKMFINQAYYDGMSAAWLRQAVRIFISYFLNELVTKANLSIMVIGCLAVAMAVVFLQRKQALISPRRNRAAALLVISFGLIVLGFALSSGLRYVLRDYYVVPWCALMIAVIAVIFDTVPNRTLAYGLVLISAGSMAFLGWQQRVVIKNGIYAHQSEGPKGARQLNGALPPKAIIGSSDPGVLAYYANFPVVNLDGLANSEIAPFVRASNAIDWILRSPITHVSVRTEWLETPTVLGFGSLLHLGPGKAGMLPILRGNQDIWANHFVNEIDVSSKSSEKFFGAGWAAPFRGKSPLLSIGPKSDLILPLCSTADYRIAMDLAAVNTPFTPLVINAIVDGEVVSRFAAPIGENARWEFNLPAPHASVTRLSLVYSKTTNYRALKITSDARDLAIQLTKVSIQPVSAQGSCTIATAVH